MGIKNLWQLLSPVGRSVSIETLAGKVSQGPLPYLSCRNERRIDTINGIRLSVLSIMPHRHSMLRHMI